MCQAKGGSMHLTKASAGMLGSYAIVGAHLPMAAGAAWSAQLRGTGQVAVAFFGDGATNIGAFHEALNLAAVWSLPVLFICENNLYMEYTPIGAVTAVPNPAADRAPGLRAAGRGDRRQRRGRRWPTRSAGPRPGPGPAAGPTLLEARTYRHFGHSRTDPASYRPAEEVEQWLSRDPLDAGPGPAGGRSACPTTAVDGRRRAGRRDRGRGGGRRPRPRRPPIPGEALTDVWADGGSAWRT